MSGKSTAGGTSMTIALFASTGGWCWSPPRFRTTSSPTNWPTLYTKSTMSRSGARPGHSYRSTRTVVRAQRQVEHLVAGIQPEDVGVVEREPPRRIQGGEVLVGRGRGAITGIRWGGLTGRPIGIRRVVGTVEAPGCRSQRTGTEVEDTSAGDHGQRSGTGRKGPCGKSKNL
jgi:hypothetical protein